MASLTRRGFLHRATLLGCSAAASPLLTTMTLADAPWDDRLVVIILRGAMDGLDVVRPVGDGDLAGLRPTLAAGPEALPLDGFFAMHAGLGALMPLWAAGELAFVHAVSTPYRDKRSHFDGQDILEAGTGRDVPVGAVQGGWLNRMLGAMPGIDAQTGFVVGDPAMLLMTGEVPVTGWAPETVLALSEQSRRLIEAVYHDDPLFRTAAAEAVGLAQTLGDPVDAGSIARGGGGRRPSPGQSLGAFAAARLRGQTRIAAFSLAGWDTHGNQQAALTGSLRSLADAVLALRDGLGPVWGRTTVLAMTEFGRTARENGTRGTDHGTGGAMLAAGGAVRGGRVLGAWPGLAEADLYDRRDLMPTADVRRYAGWAMRGLFRTDAGLIDRTVFPGLDMGKDPGLLL